MRSWGWVALALFSIGLSAQDSDTIPLNRTTSTFSNDSDASATLGESPTPTARDVSASPSSTDLVGKKEAASNRPYIATLDTYGSSRISSVIVRQTLGEELNQWLKMGLEGDSNSVRLEARLTKAIREKFGFVSADFSVVQYFIPGDMAIHITLDVVEPQDVKVRMPFMPEPKQRFQDPGGLIASWREYENIALNLVESGQIVAEAEAGKCKAFHCPFGHKHARLKKYEKIFVEGVKKNKEALIRIQSQDARPEFRASATYLLAYLKDGRKVVSLMVDRIRDPDVAVRNNALRVLGDVAEFHPDLVIPMAPVLEALQFPRVSDRTKALYVVYLTAMNSPEARDKILFSSFPVLVSLMMNQQPDSRDIAHALLKKLSGKDFAATDRLSWEHWYARFSKDRLPSNK